MNKIFISTKQNSDVIAIAERLSKEYNKTFAIQDYDSAYNLIHGYDFPMYDQLISDGPGYNLKHSFKENIYANYDVVVVSLLSLNIIAEAVMNDFNCFIGAKDLTKDNQQRGTYNYAKQNFKNYLILDQEKNIENQIKTLWSKDD